MGTRRPRNRTRALAALALSVVLLSLGTALAARRYPGGFDWAYTVMSALASRKHNPEGAAYFAAGLSLSIGLLWPAVTWIAALHDASRGLGRFGVRALRCGVVLGVLIGAERLFFFHFSQIVRKGHEALAALCFLALYAGVLALHLHRRHGRTTSSGPAFIAIAPLLAIGLSQLALYLDQRDLGWVDASWRELGVPIWLSFAFWQWLAAAALWASIGYLALAPAPR